VETFLLAVCPVTGDPGCMDCVEGQCEGVRMEPATVEVHRCAECGADDAFGSLFHEPTCSGYELTETAV